MGIYASKLITLKPIILEEAKIKLPRILRSTQEGPSSSGSASALAPNMCAFSIGTETDSSVMFPAARNAVVGIKPIVGLTSTLGVIPEAPSMDTVGSFGRSVEDATIILDVIGENKNSIPESRADASQSTVDQHVPRKTYTLWLTKKDALKDAKFGLPWRRVWEAASKSSNHKSEYIAFEAPHEADRKSRRASLRSGFSEC